MVCNKLENLGNNNIEGIIIIIISEVESKRAVSKVIFSACSVY
jgi:hypothetical protein